MNDLKGFRTIIFNILGSVIPVLQTTDLATILTPSQMAIYTLLIGIGNLVLRTFTDTKIFQPK